MASRRKKNKNREKVLWIIVGVGILAAFVLISMAA